MNQPQQFRKFWEHQNQKKIHYLKSYPEPFQAVWDRRKSHEVRVFDRAFQVGDIVVLQEWSQKIEKYSGREIAFGITYITKPGTWDLPEDVGVFSFQVLSPIFKSQPVNFEALAF